MLQLVLTYHGHTVVEAANGRVGLRLLHDDDTDLVITDLVMPETEGFEVLAEIKRLPPKVKVIVITGGVRGKTADFLEMALRLGAHKALAKPFAQAALLAAIDELIPPAAMRVPAG